MHAEKPASHHAASWLVRAGALVILSGGTVAGLHAAQLSNAEHSPVSDAGNAIALRVESGASSVSETQAEKGAAVAADIALGGLIPLVAGGSWQLVLKRQGSAVEPAEQLETV